MNGQQLISELGKRDLSQNWLAKQLRVNKSTVWRWSEKLGDLPERVVSHIEMVFDSYDHKQNSASVPDRNAEAGL
jgi:ribosome-binding protein aMBF1 (putative translation factor)